MFFQILTAIAPCANDRPRASALSREKVGLSKPRASKAVAHAMRPPACLIHFDRPLNHLRERGRLITDLSGNADTKAADTIAG